MLKHSRSWDGLTPVLAHDQTEKKMSGIGQDRTSETTSLLSGNEDDVDDEETSTGVKWSLLKEHKNIICQWTGLSKKPSFFQKMTKACNEEKEPLVSSYKKAKIHQNKTEDARPGVNHARTSMMEPFKCRRNKPAVKEVVSCPVVGNMAQSGRGPEWAEEAYVTSYFMQQMADISEQLQMEEISPLKNETGNLLLLSNVDPHQADLSYEEDVDPQPVDVLQSRSTHLASSQEFASYADTVQDMAPYLFEKDPSLAMIPSMETSSQIGGLPITGSLDRKCCNTKPFMIEMTAVKNRQDLLEKEFLQLNSRYHSDYNIVMECLREQHLRCSQFLANMTDLKEQQHAEVGNMKEQILYMKERMAYQFCEQDRDIWDKLILFQSHLSKFEKKRNNVASVNKANSIQIFYNKVLNLLPTTVTNTCQILYDKFMMNCLPVMATILLTCFSAVYIQDNPLTAAPLYVTLILVLVQYGDLHNWSPMSVTLQRSRVGTQAMRLVNKLRLNECDFRSVIEEAWELILGG